ncbi:unnamed protein product, partial [Soboliphyme baturini]|uniref:L-2-hydroxyglutarate dehydrogenase, mitochondrial n=1 Tax=Soboliphyme baturini TaxID=241478 RepID=A0A183IG49_9BILA
NEQFDIVVVGGGIVGCAAARELSIRHPIFKIAVVDKEDKLAFHQSSRNSGVIHAGIYYAPGSLKAKLCVRGSELAYKYLAENNIPYKRCGKLIVAVEPEEVPRLHDLFERGQKNNVRDLKIIEQADIIQYEPHCRGLKAIWSPHTGIVDWGRVTHSFGDDVVKRGGKLFLNFKVLRAKYVITCCGLQSDRVAALTGCSPIPKIVPFRGEYLLLKPEKRYLIRGNIYPVPNPTLPFLGVHFTPRMNGDVWLGPNAVLAYKREGYKYRDISIADLIDSLAFRGMQKLAFKYLQYGFSEMYRGIFISAQVKQLQRYVPELHLSDVSRGPAGVRAQALDASGKLVDDFIFDYGKGALSHRVLHVRNAPSPAATSSLAIAEAICEKAKEQFQL